MKLLLRFLTLAISASLFTSCMQQSTIVKVKKDGSGEIFTRYHFSPQVTAMMGNLGALGGDLGGDAPDPQALLKPSVDSMKTDGANFGEGVAYNRHDYKANGQGWQGYMVVYAFNDINKVKIGANSIPSGFKEMAEQSGQDVDLDTDEGQLTFEHADGVLKVKSDLATSGLDSITNDDKLKEAQANGMKPSQALQAAAGMFAGMRTGIYLKAEGGIAETNAQHRVEDMITLSDAQMDKMFTDPDMAAFIDKAAADPEAITDAEVKKLMTEIDGMTVDTQEEITVKFK